MFKLTWKVNGRTVPANGIANALSTAIKAEADRKIEATVRQVRCPVHGSAPHSIRFVRLTGDKVSVRYQTCCDVLTQAVERLL